MHLADDWLGNNAGKMKGGIKQMLYFVFLYYYFFTPSLVFLIIKARSEYTCAPLLPASDFARAAVEFGSR